MKHLLALALLLSGFVSGLLAGTDRVQLGEDRFVVEIETPLHAWSTQHGPRFDTTGAVVSVKIDGQEFLTRGGLADEFNPREIPPPGYDDAQPGEPFLKVGVGVLRRINERRYIFRGPYPVVEWARVQRDSPNDDRRRLVLSQRINAEQGWAYTYTKTYEIDPPSRTLVIRYRLKNTGRKSIVIEQYNHNWFRLGDEPTGPHHRLDAPFVLEEGLTLDEPQTEPTYRMAPQQVPADRNRATLRNTTNGQWVEFSGDFAVNRFALFADPGTYSPEVFGHWEISPGETAAWSRTYRFGIDPKDES